MQQLRLAAATLWTGALWGGALFAWQFFAVLERGAAGGAVTVLFRTQAWIGIACALIVLLTRPGKRVALLVLAMLASALTIRCGLMPMMDQLKALVPPGAVLDAALKTRFGMLHLASTGFYLIECVLGWMVLRRAARG
jgi:hypothetical protein